MAWRNDLGKQIKDARIKAGLTQLQLAERTSVKREHISNIELGKNSPAVKIVTDIALALKTTFQLEGCNIEPAPNQESAVGPSPVARQMSLQLGVEHHFSSASLTATEDEGMVELRAVFVGLRTA